VSKKKLEEFQLVRRQLDRAFDGGYPLFVVLDFRAGTGRAEKYKALMEKAAAMIDEEIAVNTKAPAPPPPPQPAPIPEPVAPPPAVATEAPPVDIETVPS
jgi:hypothetical protein